MFGGYLGKLETFHASVLFEICLFRVTFLRYWSCCWCLQERYQLLDAWKNDISVQIEAQAVWQYLRVLLWQPSYSPTRWGKHLFNLPDLQLLNFLESFKIFTFFSSWSCFSWIGGTLFESQELYEKKWEYDGHISVPSETKSKVSLLFKIRFVRFIRQTEFRETGLSNSSEVWGTLKYHIVLL